MSRHKERLIQKLEKADIYFSGQNVQGSLVINVIREEFYDRVAKEGSLGFGESYMDGWWETEELDRLFYRLFKSGVARTAKLPWKFRLKILKSLIVNQQRLSKAEVVAKTHYNIGNNIYERMLDPYMVYSCGYWSSPLKPAATLAEAQIAKMDLICRKLDLKPGQKILDVGGGWGGFARYAAENYGVSVYVITNSREQYTLGRKKAIDLPVYFYFADYRELHDWHSTYDHAVSVGMIEHVGHKNYRRFIKAVDNVLKEGGSFLLHTIGRQTSVTVTDPWIGKYIFPNSMIPSVNQLTRAMSGLFVSSDAHNIGPDYDKTLMAWYNNFENAWPELKNKYPERFRRMWRYYLLSSAAAFRAGELDVWQLLLHKAGSSGNSITTHPGGYVAVR